MKSKYIWEIRLKVPSKVSVKDQREGGLSITLKFLVCTTVGGMQMTELENRVKGSGLGKKIMGWVSDTWSLGCL